MPRVGCARVIRTDLRIPLRSACVVALEANMVEIQAVGEKRGGGGGKED